MRACLLCLALTACSAVDCGPDGGLDGGVADAAASLDADGARDAAVTCVSTPGTLAIVPLAQILTPTTMAPYPAADETRSVSLHVYRRDAVGTAVTYAGVGSTALDLGPLVAGEYELAVELDGYVVGAARLHPEHCSGPDASSPYCAPLPFSIEPCQARLLAVALYCDPYLRPCPAVAWPWDL